MAMPKRYKYGQTQRELRDLGLESGGGVGTGYRLEKLRTATSLGAFEEVWGRLFIVRPCLGPGNTFGTVYMETNDFSLALAAVSLVDVRWGARYGKCPELLQAIAVGYGHHWTVGVRLVVNPYLDKADLSKLVDENPPLLQYVQRLKG